MDWIRRTPAVTISVYRIMKRESFIMRHLFILLMLCVLSCSPVPEPSEENSLSKAEAKDGWMLLFNGKDLTGWKVDKWNPDCFSIEEGAIKCKAKPSMLYYDGEGKDLKNFHFIADVMTLPGANSGVFFHTTYQDKGWPRGHEAQVNQTHLDPVKTGSIYIVAKHLEAPAKNKEWFRYEIIVKGDKITTVVDGKTVVEYTEPAEAKGKRRSLSSGTIALQAHDPGSVVFYKNIKVKACQTAELTDSQAQPLPWAGCHRPS